MVIPVVTVYYVQPSELEVIPYSGVGRCFNLGEGHYIHSYTGADPGLWKRGGTRQSMSRSNVCAAHSG